MRLLPLVILLAAGGCEPSAPEAPAEPPGVTPPAEPSAWRSRDGSSIVAVTDEATRAELEAAAARARATVDAARAAWLRAPDRPRWAVKWAAATVDGGVEDVWVRPVSWTAHRIEGVLASPPQRELLCGARAGDPVAFAAEELTDWVHETDDGREGGFTVDVLERRFR